MDQFGCTKKTTVEETALKKTETMFLLVKNYKTTPLLLGLSMLLATSCISTKGTVVWVNSIKTECYGLAPMECISIHRGNTMNNPNWELFYTDIEGFTFEPGYFQKIEIKEEHLDMSEVPADASSIRYTLIKTLEKKADMRLSLNDIWAVKRINGAAVDPSTPVPNMEISITRMQVSGNNGCNNYTGKIEKISSSDIQFGNIASTKKMCQNMTTPNMYDKALSISSMYTLKNTTLTFFNKDGDETISFIKVD